MSSCKHLPCFCLVSLAKSRSSLKCCQQHPSRIPQLSSTNFRLSKCDAYSLENDNDFEGGKKQIYWGKLALTSYKCSAGNLWKLYCSMEKNRNPSWKIMVRQLNSARATCKQYKVMDCNHNRQTQLWMDEIVYELYSIGYMMRAFITPHSH